MFCSIWQRHIFPVIAFEDIIDCFYNRPVAAVCYLSISIAYIAYFYSVTYVTACFCGTKSPEDVYKHQPQRNLGQFFLNPCCFTLQFTKVIQLGTPDIATALHLNGFDIRAVGLENPFYALSMRNFAYCEGRI